MLILDDRAIYWACAGKKKRCVKCVDYFIYIFSATDVRVDAI